MYLLARHTTIPLWVIEFEMLDLISEILIFVLNNLVLKSQVGNSIKLCCNYKTASYPAYNIQLHLIVRFQFGSVGKGVLFHCHYSQVHSDPNCCPVSWGCSIHWLLLCRGVRAPLNECPVMILNNLMVRFQLCWSFGQCGVPLHCHYSLAQSGNTW